MCPLRCHYLRVLDGMVDMFIDTLNVSSKMSSTCPRSCSRYVMDTLNVSSEMSLSTCPRSYGKCLLTHWMCPLRCHYLRVLDRMVDMFIDTWNVSSKISLSTCPQSYGRYVY
jgi:hypothetical protein